MISRISIFIVLAASVALSGCLTLVDDTTIGEQRAGTDALKVEVYKMRDQVAEMQVKLTKIEEETSSVQGLRGSELKDAKSRLDEIEKKIGGIEASQEQMKKEIVDNLVRKLEKSGALNGSSAGKSQAKSSSPRTDGKKQVERGYEHVVKTGETLSAIATAYKVTPAVIIKANNLANPNALRVGQNLFIPE